MAPKMVKVLHAITLLAILATTTANLDAYIVVPFEKCQPECQSGQACTEHQVACITAPCNPEHVCVSKAKVNQTNPCNPKTCPQGSSCIAASLNDGSPIAACIPPCWVKTCGNNVNETCVMQGCDGGYKEPTCAPLQQACHPVPTSTCANVKCAHSPCKMINCGPVCPPLV